LRKFDRLLFGTAGKPKSAKALDTAAALKHLRGLGLEAMELEYVYGTFPDEHTARRIALAAETHDIRLTAHGPYYINLYADAPEKREASRKRLFDTAYYGSLSGAESITFHAGFFLGRDPEEVYSVIRDELREMASTLESRGIDVDVRPELTGKASQFGSLEDIIGLAKEVDGVKPCIDWSHLYARTGTCNSAVEFDGILRRIRAELGDGALKDCHMHVSGIEFSGGGEKKHRNLDDSDFNYKDLLKVLKDNEVCGILICESPSLENDALLLKECYESL